MLFFSKKPNFYQNSALLVAPVAFIKSVLEAPKITVIPKQTFLSIYAPNTVLLTSQ